MNQTRISAKYLYKKDVILENKLESDLQEQRWTGFDTLVINNVIICIARIYN